MSEDIIAEIKRDYIYSLANQGDRADGRKFDEFRPISIETGVIDKAEGSSQGHDRPTPRSSSALRCSPASRSRTPRIRASSSLTWNWFR